MDEETHLQTARMFTQSFGYKEDTRTRAVYLVGSSAIGKEDTYSDIDMMIVVETMIPEEERINKLRQLNCQNIMLSIAGVDNPALPVESQAIDKFVFQDNWFDVSYHLPDQLDFCFNYVTLVDKDNLTPQLCAAEQTYSEDELKERIQADLRLLRARIHRYEKYARRKEWVGMELSAIKRLLVDIVMVLNDKANYNRHSSRMSRLLRELPDKPDHFDQNLLDILHLDNREHWRRKLEMMEQLEDDLTDICEERWGPISMFDD